MGGWLDQMGIRLTSASTGVGVEVGSELGKRSKQFYNNLSIQQVNKQKTEL